MAYWITTHWPHPEPDEIPWHVYLKEDDARKGNRLGVNDVVFFFEARKCRIDGKLVTSIRRVGAVIETILPLRVGAGGLVGHATVAESCARIPTSEPRYYYGDGGHWTDWVKCNPITPGVTVAYKEMLVAIDLPPNMPAHLFGLRQIDRKEKAEKLLEMLRRP